MFYQNRFTERARQALTLAQEAAGFRSVTATLARSTCCSACCVKAAALPPRHSLPQA